MHGFEGDLLIGGMTLKHLQVELEEELPEGATSDWLLSGRLTLDPHESEFLEVGRRYRLQLPDGRAGPVVIGSLSPNGDEHVIAEFSPQDALVRQR